MAENIEKTPRECVEQVQSWLADYNFMCHEVVRMHADYQSTMAEMSCNTAAPIAKYGGMPGGGGDGSSAVEQIIGQREAALCRLAILQKDLDRTCAIIHGIDKAMTLLSEIEQKIVRMRFCKQARWGEVAEQLGISTRWACACGYRALAKMAQDMFGLSKTDVRLNRMRFGCVWR